MLWSIPIGLHLHTESLNYFVASFLLRQIFVRNLVITEQLELLRLLVSTCVAVVSTEDEFDSFDSTCMKNLIFSSALSASKPIRDPSGYLVSYHHLILC